MSELAAGVGYFLYVFFKAAQQKNVAFDHYKWIMPISYAMAFTEVMVVSLIARNAATHGISLDLIWFALAIGTGGVTGALLSMYLHNRFIKK